MHEHTYTYPEPEATSPDTELYRALLQQFLNVGSSSACPGSTTFMPLSPAQVPLTGQPSAGNLILYAETLMGVFPQVADNASEAPRALNDSNAFTTIKSVGEDAGPFLYSHELEAIRESLHARRGSDAQEKFMFDFVAPFIESHGAKALRDIDLTVEAMPRTAKYYFPYLLGHIEHEATQQERLDLLARYSVSEDEDVRDGAVEALGYLADS
jgi:hypothetical protein